MSTDKNWIKEANCKDKPIHIFYPDETVLNPARFRELALQARQICDECPVVKECLDYALQHESIGFWGGMTARQRQKERTLRNIKIEMKRGNFIL